MVQSFKNAIKANRSDRSIQHKLDRFLFAYRTAPHATTGHSPAQLLFGRNLKSRLDLLKPNIKRVVDWRLLKNEKGTLVFFSEWREGHGSTLSQRTEMAKRRSVGVNWSSTVQGSRRRCYVETPRGWRCDDPRV